MQDDIKRFKFYYEQTNDSIYLEYIRFIEKKDINILRSMTNEQVLNFFRLESNYDYFAEAVMEFKYILLSNDYNYFLTKFILERSNEQDFSDSKFVSSFNSSPKEKLSQCLCYSNNISMFIVYKILDRIDEIQSRIYKLYRDTILNNELYFNKFIKYLVVNQSDLLSVLNDLSDDAFIDIYRKNPNLFLSLSLKDKIQLVDIKIKTDECKKYFFDEFKLESNIDVLGSALYKYIDQDILLEYALKNKKITLLGYFDFEHQYKFLEECSEYLNRNANWLSDVNWEVVEKLLKEGINFNVRILFRSDNKYVLDYVKNEIIGLSKIDNLKDYREMFTSDFFSNFSDDELSLIKKKIIIPSDDKELGILYGMIERVKNGEIFEALLKNSLDYIFNNGLNVKVSVSLDFIKKYVPGSLEKTFIENLGHKFLLIEAALNDKEKYEVIMNYLMKYPDIFQEYDGYSFGVTNCNLDYLNSLFPFLCREYRKEFYKLNKQSDVVLSYMKSDILSDPSLVSNYEFLEIFDFNEQKQLLNSISYDQLVNIVFNDSFEKHLAYTDVLFQRRYEAIDYLNSDIFDKTMYPLFISNIYPRILYSYDDNIDSFIDKIGCRALLSFNKFFKKSLGDDKFFKILGNLLNDSDNYQYINSTFLSQLNDNDFDKYLKLSSFPSLLYSLFQLNSDKLKNALFEKIKTDNVLLYNPYVYTNLDKFILFLNDDQKNFIERIVENNLVNSKYYYLFKDKIDNASIGAKASFTITNRFLDDSKIKIINELYKKDKFLFDNLDYRLFTYEIYCLGDQLIILLNRYPVLVDTVCKIMDSACKDMFINLNKYLIKNNYTDDIYSEHMWCLLYYFKNYGYDLGNINNYDNNSLLEYLEERMYLLLKNTINKDLKRPLIQEEYINADYDINYHSRKYKMLDDLFKSSTDIERMQDLFFAKYFGLHGSIIRSFIYSYGTNYEDIQNIVDTSIPYKYISLINKVLSISDIDLMKELYAKNSIFYNTSDYIQITKTLDRAYNKAVVGDTTNDCMVENHTFSINGKNINTNVTILGDEGIFVHSTDAYGSLELINDDYFYSWQYNSNTANNGICTCYITNSNQGSAPVKGAGVLFGFRNVSEESIAVYAPYDIISVNTGIKILNLRDELKMRLDKIPSFTRHTHNEFVLYRRDKKTDSDYPCLMPTSIVIYEDMPDSIKKNSFKAIEDFKKHGIELEVVYRDRKKIASDEMNKIEIYIQEYYKTNDLTLLANIIDKYETNICGCDFIDIDKDILFKTDMVKQVLIDTLCDIENNNEMERFEEFIDILEKENYKFKIIEENLADRAHTFILYDSIKSKIDNVRKTLYGGEAYGFRK